jgi:apolipoprotein N-acyltransferase
VMKSLLMKTIHNLTPSLHWSDALAAFISGVLLLFAFPPFNFYPIVFIALIPLLTRLQPDRLRINAEMGLLFGCTFYLGLLYWLHHVTTGGMLTLVIVLSVYQSCQCVAIGWSKRYPYWIPIAGLIWLMVEYLRSLGPLSFAWGYLGHSFYSNVILMTPVFWIGVPGLSFIIFGLNAALADGICRWSIYQRIYSSTEFLPLARIRFQKIFLAGFAALLVLVGVYGITTINRDANNSAISKPLRVALIQGGFEQQEKETATVEKTLETYLSLSEQSIEDSPDLIVWPESTITMPLEYWPEGVSLIQEFSDRFDVELLIGSVSGLFTTERKWKFWNKAFLFSPGNSFDIEGASIDISQLPSYAKTHLVPFGEWIPLGKYWPFNLIETLIEESGAGIFQPGSDLTIFKLRNGIRFAVTICFESTLPQLWRQAKKQGADFIVNITNDAWYKRSTGLEQHLSQCCFRAAENRLYVVRTANTGITGVISPNGSLISSLPPYKSTYGVFLIPIQSTQ